MADTENKLDQKDLMDVTMDDIKKFMEVQVKNHSCPACGNASWELFVDDKTIPGLIILQRDGGFGLPPPTTPVAPVVCTTCGYMRIHSVGRIALWKKFGK